MDIGRALASTLAERKLSAAEIARRTGLSTGALSKYKSGKATPSLEALIQVSAAIGIRLSELIARAETAQPELIPVIQDEHREYRVEDSTGEVLAALSGMSERQRRALLNFLEAMEEQE